MASHPTRQRVLSRFNALATSLHRELLCLGHRYSHLSPEVRSSRSSTTVTALNNVFQPNMLQGIRGASTFNTTGVPFTLLSSAEAHLQRAQRNMAKGLYAGTDGADEALVSADFCLRQVGDIVEGVRGKLESLEKRIISKQGDALVRLQEAQLGHL